MVGDMNLKLIISLTVAVFCLAGSVRATTPVEPDTQQHAGRKLGRGVANVLLGITELPNAVNNTTKNEGGAAGVTLGVGRGLVRFVWRELAGVYEILTFPIPINGYQPVIQPEFPVDDIGP